MHRTRTPRPLRELSDEALRAVTVLATDCDDTLTEHGALQTRSLAALHALAEAKIPCVIATGRPLGWAEVLARLLPVRGVVAENGGAFVFRENGALCEGFADDEETRAQGMARARACVREITARFSALHVVPDRTLRATDVAIDIGETHSVSIETVRAASAMAHEQGLFAVASTVHLHVSYRAPDKFTGLVALGRALALCGDEDDVRARWMYVGDSPNDAPAFAAIERSVGVASVFAFAQSMPAWPAFVTEGEAAAGFDELVRRLLAAREAPTTRGP